MSSKYSVPKGNECVTMLKSIASLCERVEPRRAFVVLSFLFLIFPDTVAPHNKLSRSKVAFHRSTALAALSWCCSLYQDCTAEKKKVQCRTLCYRNVCLQLLTDKLNDWGRAIQREREKEREIEMVFPFS